MEIESFVNELSKIRSSSTFLSMYEYHNKYDEIADYQLIFHVSYRSLLEKSISQLSVYSPLDNLESEAKASLLQSYSKSLSSLEEDKIDEKHYHHYRDDDGNIIKGIKLHKDSVNLHLYGTVLNKRVIKTGSYPTVNSKPLTLAKNKISSSLPISKWRQFKITPLQVSLIKVENRSFDLQDFKR